MIKAVIFDFGGVISPMCWDPYIISDIIVRVLKKHGVAYPRDFKEIFRDVSDSAFFEMGKKRIEISLREILKKALDKSSIMYDELIIGESLELIRNAEFCEIRPDAKEILSELKQMGLKIGLISNTPDVHPFRALLRAGLYELFDAIILSCWTRYRKPHPIIFEIALRKLHVKANEAIYVGDMPNIDVVGAKKAGLISVLMLRGERYWERMGVTREKVIVDPDYKINELHEIIDLVMKLNVNG